MSIVVHYLVLNTVLLEVVTDQLIMYALLHLSDVGTNTVPGTSRTPILPLPALQSHYADYLGQSRTCSFLYSLLGLFSSRR